jgi:hypothetical protein
MGTQPGCAGICGRPEFRSGHNLPLRKNPILTDQSPLPEGSGDFILPENLQMEISGMEWPRGENYVKNGQKDVREGWTIVYIT